MTIEASQTPPAVFRRTAQNSATAPRKRLTASDLHQRREDGEGEAVLHPAEEHQHPALEGRHGAHGPGPAQEVALGRGRREREVEAAGAALQVHDPGQGRQGQEQRGEEEDRAVELRRLALALQEHGQQRAPEHQGVDGGEQPEPAAEQQPQGEEQGAQEVPHPSFPSK